MNLRASPKARHFVRRIYDEVEFALWVFLGVFCIYFGVFVGPQIPEMQAKSAAVRARDIAAEHHDLCRAFGKEAGSREYATCLLDVQAFRSKVEKRLADEISF